MKKINSMDYLLVFGSIILFLSGIALMCNEFFSNYLVKTMGIACLGVILYLLSLVFKYILHVDKSFKVATLLGGASIVIAYAMAGYNELFGSWFSISGEGVQLFLASIAFLVMILSVLMAVLNKSYNYVNITFISIFVGIFHLLSFFRLDYQISLLIVGIILLVCNVCKVSKYIYSFSSMTVFVYTLLCVIYGFESNFILSSLVAGINSICLLSVLAKQKSTWLELLVVTSFIILIVSYLNIKMVNVGLLLVLTTFIVCVFELAINTFKLISNNAISVISKLICFFLLIVMFYEAKNFFISQVIALSFLTVTTIANAYIIKHDAVEKYLLPIKLCFVVSGLFNLINTYTNIELNVIYLLLVLSLLLVSIYKILMKKMMPEKVIYLIINIFIIIVMAFLEENGVVEFILKNIILIISYLVMRNKDNVALNRVFYTFIVIMLAENENVSMLSSMLNVGIFSVLAYVSRKDKYGYLIAVIFLYLTLIDILDLVIVSGALMSVLSSVFFLTLVGISSEMLFDDVKHKNVFVGLLITLNLLSLLEYNQEFIVIIYSLIVSLIMILISLKNDNYKVLHYIGLIIGALNLLVLVSFLEGLPAAIYLFIIALVLIVIVSVMVYKYQHREIKEVKEEVAKPKAVIQDFKPINYCGECGKKVSMGEKFCGNCGNKIK